MINLLDGFIVSHRLSYVNLRVNDYIDAYNGTYKGAKTMAAFSLLPFMTKVKFTFITINSKKKDAPLCVGTDHLHLLLKGDKCKLSIVLPVNDIDNIICILLSQ